MSWVRERESVFEINLLLNSRERELRARAGDILKDYVIKEWGTYKLLRSSMSWEIMVLGNKFKLQERRT